MIDIFKVGKSTVRLVKGDITEMVTDVIVNAANATLMGGGGVDGAIHRKGGPRILQECQTIRRTAYPNGLPTGQAVITGAGDLKAKKVIHTVGPVWHGGNCSESQLLSEAYEDSLHLAAEKGFRSVAFPSISTGAYGYPVEQACRIALSAVKKFLESPSEVIEVVFVLFSQNDLEIYRQAASEILDANMQM
jgi:O-acetyl-ADP-ribose deacetylase (regulator of RNase III)